MMAVRDYFGAALEDALGIDREAVEAERQRVNALRLRAMNGDDSAVEALLELGDDADDDEGEEW